MMRVLPTFLLMMALPSVGLAQGMRRQPPAQTHMAQAQTQMGQAQTRRQAAAAQAAAAQAAAAQAAAANQHNRRRATPPPAAPTAQAAARLRRVQQQQQAVHASAVVAGFSARRSGGNVDIVVRGQRFAPGTRVYFAGAVVTASAMTTTSITFRVPAGSAGGVIALRPPGGTNLTVGHYSPTVQRAAVTPLATVQATARQNWQTRRAQLAADEAARAAALLQAEQELEQSRQARRVRQSQTLQAQFEAGFLAQPAVQTELAVHAERQAQIERMARLADVKYEEGLIVRVDVLQQREQQRHEQRMADLRAAFEAAQ